VILLASGSFHSLSTFLFSVLFCLLALTLASELERLHNHLV
jgi:hypothetical protein